MPSVWCDVNGARLKKGSRGAQTAMSQRCRWFFGDGCSDEFSRAANVVTLRRIPGALWRVMARQSDVMMMIWWYDDMMMMMMMRYAIKAELCALGMLIWSRLNIESQDFILCAAATWQPVMMWWLLSDLCCLSHFTAWAKLRQHLTLLRISCTNYSFDAC